MRSRTGRDLVVLAVVVAVLAALVRVGSQVSYAVPVSIGNGSITNSREVIADAEDRLQELSQAYGGRIAEDAACYFFRPLGPTQGALPAQMFAPYLELAGITPSEPPDVLDLLLCGPVELATQSPLLTTEPPPWLTGLAFYYAESPTSLRGEFQLLIQSELAALTSSGGLQPEHLLTANGRTPDADALADPSWREVAPSGDPPDTPLPGVEVPELPPDVEVPELPPDVTFPPDMSLPEPPPGVTLPPPPGG